MDNSVMREEIEREQALEVDGPLWRLENGSGPLIASALHDGHLVRRELVDHLLLSDADRLREEDPFTAQWARGFPTRVVGLRSRFEVDLNRPRSKAVYRTPEDAWGLRVWKHQTPDDVFTRSLAAYDHFYRAMHELLSNIAREHGRFVVYDLHSYNHRRAGPDGPHADYDGNPQVNVGTGTMDRRRWGPVVDAFIDTLRSFDFPGGRLDVRENVRFFGGNWPGWIHREFPDSGVALAIEFKKFFMDEWTGLPDAECIRAIGDALQATTTAVSDALQQT